VEEDAGWQTAVRNPKRMAELGLTEYGLERFALAGNVNDWIERIGELAELGASRLWLSTEAATSSARSTT
jgi:hypothetical protein